MKKDKSYHILLKNKNIERYVDVDIFQELISGINVVEIFFMSKL